MSALRYQHGSGRCYAPHRDALSINILRFMRSIFSRREKPASRTLFAICILAGLLIGSPAQAQQPPITSYQASSTLNGWPLSRAFDGVTGTIWSSFTHPSAGATEWIAFWF